jgi:hypothetical protein
VNYVQAARTTDGEPRDRGARDLRIFLAICVVSVLLVTGLWVISRNAPSARQLESVALSTAGVTGEQGCANFASFWMQKSGLNVPSEAIAGMSNCRLSKDGIWFVPAGPTDPRLPDSEQLTTGEQEQSAVLSAQLADDLMELELTLPRSLRESLKANYDPENLPVFGHTKKGRIDLGAKWARYIRVAQAFLLSPQHAVLADYVGWVMERRQNAVSQFETACFADPDNAFLWRACQGLRSEFGIANIPLYWELNDPVLIQEYLTDRVQSGKPLPAATPATRN